MAHSTVTDNYGLPLFTSGNKPTWNNEWNPAMKTIDSTLKSFKTINESQDGDIESLKSRVTTLEGKPIPDVTSIQNAIDNIIYREGDKLYRSVTLVPRSFQTLNGSNFALNCTVSLNGGFTNAHYKNLSKRISLEVYPFSKAAAGTSTSYPMIQAMPAYVACKFDSNGKLSIPNANVTIYLYANYNQAGNFEFRTSDSISATLM